MLEAKIARVWPGEDVSYASGRRVKYCNVHRHSRIIVPSKTERRSPSVPIETGGNMPIILTRNRVASALLLLAALAAGSFADTIHLKDGSIIKGRITTFGGGKFVVVVGEGSRRKSM